MKSIDIRHDDIVSDKHRSSRVSIIYYEFIVKGHNN